LEATGSLKWKPIKDLQVKADVFLWDGAYFQDKTLQTIKMAAVADLNVGAEFSVLPKLNIWLQMNNVFNNSYQRWNQYTVLGFNVLGGVVYSFR
jgi:outer membrane cobalamin receptor